MSLMLLTIHLLDRSDFIEALYTYREEQRTLAGLSLSQIEEGILNILRNKYLSRQVLKYVLVHSRCV